MTSLHRRVDSELRALPITIGSDRFIADWSGALHWPRERLLIVSDLHLEKGAVAASRGQLLPPYDTRETLDRLARVLDRYEPRTVVALGDSFHRGEAAAGLSDLDRKIIAILQEGRRWVWIAGNHDPIVDAAATAAIGGETAGRLVIGGIELVHEPTPEPLRRQIAGHLHPAAKVSIDGHGFRRACFVANRHKLIMPAFGTFTGGLNVLDAAFEPVLGVGGMSVWMLGAEGLYPMPARLLRPER